LKYLPLFLVTTLLVGGCASGETIETGPPGGWEGGATQWWRAGLDTTGIYRDLETLDDMSVMPNVVYASEPIATQGISRQQFELAVRRSLIPLFRNQPEIVDSLFVLQVRPKLEGAPKSGDFSRELEEYKRLGYQLIRKHFQEPYTTMQLGKDVPVPYPDSLREQQVEGGVRIQVYLDEEGAPLSVALLESVHPLLDDIALRATTQMHWRPAYLRSKHGQWRGIPSWTRIRVVFKATG